MRCFLLASMWIPMMMAQTGIEPSIVLPPELARVLSDYESAWRAKDSTSLSKLFAEDGFVLSSGHPMVRSRVAIERFYREQGGPLFLRAVAYAAEGKVGYIIGGFSNKAGGEDLGKFTLTLRREAGLWLILSDMDNGNRGRP